jgi:hypothetical protein
LGNPHDAYELASWQCDFGDVVLVTCQFGLGDVGYGKLVKLMWALQHGKPNFAQQVKFTWKISQATGAYSILQSLE